VSSRDEQMKKLNEWFDLGIDTEPISDKDVEKFLDAAAKYHKMPALKGAAAAEAIIKAGYTYRIDNGAGGNSADC